METPIDLVHYARSDEDRCWSEVELIQSPQPNGLPTEEVPSFPRSAYCTILVVLPERLGNLGVICGSIWTLLLSIFSVLFRYHVSTKAAVLITAHKSTATSDVFPVLQHHIHTVVPRARLSA